MLHHKPFLKSWLRYTSQLVVLVGSQSTRLKPKGSNLGSCDPKLKPTPICLESKQESNYQINLLQI